MDVNETQNRECLAVVEKECDRFLAMYSPDSGVEVCEKAMAPIFAAIVAYMNVGHSPDCHCETTVDIARKQMPQPGRQVVVLLSRQHGLTFLDGVSPHGLPVVLSAHPPRQTTLRELLSIGVTPYDIVQHVKEMAMLFTMASTATQAPARA